MLKSKSHVGVKIIFEPVEPTRVSLDGFHESWISGRKGDFVILNLNILTFSIYFGCQERSQKFSETEKQSSRKGSFV